MKHLGDITKISGYHVPMVDVVIGGSPCQDLSVAGKRAGLAGERSGLYMEQIRIIKEMRHRDEQHGRTGESIRPRYMVWENVPGAFSSNQGKDFAAVLEEAIRVTEPEAPDVPVPEKGWPTSGCIMGDHWSVAWRVLDAQFWGVPQRRRRIALVADFGGQSAPEILFIRKGVSRDLDESEQERKATAGDAQGCPGADDRVGAVGFPLGFRPENVRCYDEVATTLCNGTRPGFTTGVIQPILDDQGGSRISVRYDGKCPTLRAETHGNLPCVMESKVYESHPMDSRIKELDGVCPTVSSKWHKDAADTPLVMEPAYSIGNGQVNQSLTKEIAGALNCMHDQQAVLVPVEEPIVIDRAFFNQGQNGQYDPQVYTDGTVPTLVAKGPDAVQVRYIVRRLTPLECERLQGYPDGWTDIGEWVDSKGKKHKEADSPRYKALGNSIALPPWKWVLKRLCACYERDATMASLFDGIGGFPYIWEQINGKGSCLWASEIEEFPMAVTKLRFGGNTNECF